MSPQTRKVAPYSVGQRPMLSITKHLLTEAREAAETAGCPRLVAKINSALKSWDGARRHLEQRRMPAMGGAR